MRVLITFILLATATVAASACSKGASEPKPGASQGDEAPFVPATGTVPMTKLSDGQIAGVLTTVDDAEIEQAQLALDKASNPEVQAFAKHMVEQHTASKQAGTQLASQTNIKPADSPKAQELKQTGAQMLTRLNAADANNFDITYLDGQIQEHSDVLKLIKDQLLPAVNEPALRDHLSQARDMVQQHLDRARQIQK
jgi:putative membrane protein